jgi:hypothetical protein
MKIADAIARIDELKHNTYSYSQKVGWLSRVDAMIKKHIIDTHKGSEKITFNGYTADTDPQTVLLAPEPFDEMYLRWMEAQIDYHNGEYGKYNQSIQMFKAEYNGYERWYNRNNMPIGGKMKYF